MASLLIFHDGKLYTETTSMDTFHDIFNRLTSKGEVFTYSFNTENWYKDLICIKEDEVPAIYRTLKLMLTN